jgi:3-methyl-2-oxobutanoate hydroxymethyltransferase
MKLLAKDFLTMKGRDKIVMLTCYDYSFAKSMKNNVDLMLVGDSLGNVVLGFQRTKKVTMSDMVRHLGAVRRGAPERFIVCDLPFGSYNGKGQAIKNAQILVKAGADAVKPEGKPEIVKALTQKKINVVGHIGLLPQSAKKMGVVGRAENERKQLLNDALMMEKNGAFMIILECVPKDVARQITKLVQIPTVGIGAGKDCDGQVLVSYDMLGLFSDYLPKFVRKYTDLSENINEATKKFKEDVKSGRFPSSEEVFE